MISHNLLLSPFSLFRPFSVVECFMLYKVSLRAQVQKKKKKKN